MLRIAKAAPEPALRDSYGDICTLSKTIAAVEANTSPDHLKQLGIVVRLPAGLQLTLLGPGFNAQTVKVCCHQSVYFVFWEDLKNEVPRNLQDTYQQTTPSRLLKHSV
jgi:hypothetical protein